MEGIWIRTTLGDLLNTTYIFWLRGGDFFLISGTDISGQDIKLGEYRTKERAVEIINEIQNAIKKGEKVFEMPEV